ncbi:MAG: hypothetical protein AAGF24_00010 [Cyanobacteria bacterium P01_H01_bin.121]
MLEWAEAEVVAWFMTVQLELIPVEGYLERVRRIQAERGGWHRPICADGWLFLHPGAVRWTLDGVPWIVVRVLDIWQVTAEGHHKSNVSAARLKPKEISAPNFYENPEKYDQREQVILLSSDLFQDCPRHPVTKAKALDPARVESLAIDLRSHFVVIVEALGATVAGIEEAHRNIRQDVRSRECINDLYAYAQKYLSELGRLFSTTEFDAAFWGVIENFCET